ncbi:chemotaxis protein CheB [Citrobacter freundii]|uniref:chemotaxis protein CheB n=1 Tax=Citrobacter freundii TaxID=546 RepID=UPI00129CE743|nr:chemotaxis protein CheB [Citrobacter freundii]QLS04937.1 chemotaxis protein CheB [Citrobacter freundii]QMG39930.1 chemotaxis protein CheB [Citrobacter freundii]
MSSRGIRVLILDLGSVSRNQLVKQLEDHPHISVVGQAAHRRQAMRLLQQLGPDLLILTLETSTADNVEIVETIMATSAIPILVMHFGGENAGDEDYISRGALAVLHHNYDSPLATRTLHRQVELLVGVKVIRHIKGLRYPAEPSVSGTRLAMETIETTADWPYVLAIACSTGGPQALSKLLQDLPGTFPCPVLIAQHIADGFAKNMVHWLDSVTDLKVRLAQDNDPVEAGNVYILPPEQHLIVKSNQRLATVPRQESDVYHPSCNLLLESVAEVFREKAVGLIMTGMGSDGCRGIELIVQRGGRTLAQDEESSVVFGMNKNAIDKQLIHRTIPLNGLAKVLLSMAGHGHFESTLP